MTKAVISHLVDVGHAIKSNAIDLGRAPVLVLCPGKLNIDQK